MNRQRIYTLSLVLAITLFANTAVFAQDAKSNLYILAIGVSKHEDAKLNKGVECSAKDARDFVAFFQEQEGKQYGKVHAILLADGDAVMDQIKPALNWMQAKATTQDTIMFYYSGHGGLNRRGSYTVNLANFDGLLASASLEVEPIRAMLDKVPGKRFMFFDSCFSASSTSLGTTHTTTKAMQGQGLVTFASSMGNETSQEDAVNLKNGFFTAALLEGLRGAADVNGDGTVTLAELSLYVSDRVNQLSNGRQNTTIASPATLPSNLGIARTNKAIALSQTFGR